MYIAKLQPNEDTDISYDHLEKRDYLERLHKFVKTLSAKFNDKKCSVLHHLLQYHLEKEHKDLLSGLLDEFLQIPKRNTYVRSVLIKQAKVETIVQNHFPSVGRFSSVSPIESRQLIQAVFSFLFKDPSVEDFTVYLPYCKYGFLKNTFAETKLLYGIGNQEHYINILRSPNPKKSEMSSSTSNQKEEMIKEEEARMREEQLARKKEELREKLMERKEAKYEMERKMDRKMDRKPSVFNDDDDCDEDMFSRPTKQYITTPAPISSKSSHKKPEERMKLITERVEIEFPASNITHFSAKTPVALEVDLKNIKTLLVKVFEINLANYYKDKQSEVTGDIDLDGLVAQQETVYTYQENPLHRIRRRFEFPSLQKRGIFVIEFIGGGKSSRCVVRKGHLRFIEKLSASGHIFRVFDEELNPVEKSAISLNGKVFKADEHAKILVPYNESGEETKPILLVDEQDNFLTLNSFYHRTESYALDAGIYVNRESLIPGQTTNIVVRSTLYVNDTIIPLQRIEDLSLVTTTKDIDGVEVTNTIQNFILKEDKESIFPFDVPNNMQFLSVKLSGRVKQSSSSGYISVSQSAKFQVNKIDTQTKFHNYLLRKDEAGYHLFTCDKNGDPVKNHTVRISLKSIYITEELSFQLASNEQGIIDLGPLKDIVHLEVPGESWRLLTDYHNLPSILHAKYGENIQVALCNVQQFDRSVAALMEMRNREIIRDCWDLLSYENNMLSIKGLEAGDYELTLKQVLKPGDRNISSYTILIRVARGHSRANFVFNSKRIIELNKHTRPLQLSSVTPFPNESSKDVPPQLTIRLTNTTPNTRVHVLPLQFFPKFDVNTALGRVATPPPNCCNPNNPFPNLFLSGRSLSAEYIYILERRHTNIFPGNNLEKPSMLIHPRAIQATSSSAASVSVGDNFQAAQKSMGSHYAGSKVSTVNHYQVECPSNMDFLKNFPSCLFNLKPDANSSIQIDKKTFQELGSLLQIIVVDEDEFLSSLVGIQKTSISSNDMRLSPERALNPQFHYTEQKHISEILPGQVFRIEDTSYTKVEIYDTISKIFAFYSNLTNNPTLNQFSFILEWDNLSLADKLAKYEQFGCHELHFFLYKKDPKFFEEVVKTILNHKKDKTFMDLYLLGRDLSSYTQPALFSGLNVLEKILLSERVPASKEAILKSIQEMTDMIANNPTKFNQLFGVAIKETENVVVDSDDILRENEKPFPFKQSHTQAPKRNQNRRLFGSSDENSCEDEDDEDDDSDSGSNANRNRCSDEENDIFSSAPMPAFAYQQQQQNVSFPYAQQQQNLFDDDMIDAIPQRARYTEECEEQCNDIFECDEMEQNNCEDDFFGGESIRPPPNSYNNTFEVFTSNVNQQQAVPILLPTPLLQEDKPKDDFSSYESDDDFDAPIGFGGMPNIGTSSAPRSYQKAQKSAKKVYFEKDLDNQRNANLRDKTREFSERNYYDGYSSKDLIRMSYFWADFAANSKSHFISKYFMYSTRSFTEMICSLAVLDLPLKTPMNHTIQRESSAMTIKPSSAMIVFHKVILKSDVTQQDILVSQNFFDSTNQFAYEKGEKIEIYVKDEFLTHRIYGCKVVLTNVGSVRKRVDVLLQIPVGAIPVANGFFTKSRFIDLPAYSTTNPPLLYYFYFPRPGTFNHFPVHVSQDEKVVAFNAPTTFNVVSSLTKHDTKSWAFLSQMASTKELLDFLETANMSNLNLSWMAWRMKKRDVFNKIIALLKKRFIYDSVLWSYGLYHNDTDVIFQYLQSTSIPSLVGPYLQTALVDTSNPIDSRLFEYFEYGPIINSRAHQLNPTIANMKFKSQYIMFLNTLCFTPQIGKAELMACVYYLLLQDRINDAKNLFFRISPRNKMEQEEEQAEINPSDIENQSSVMELELQYDYLNAYLDFFNDDPQIARKIAKKYSQFPLPRWQKMFAEIDKQLREKETKEVLEQDVDINEELEPELDFEVEGSLILINYENVKECTAKFYKMDIELLFSSSPFVQQNLGNFSYVKPNISLTIPLPADAELHSIDLPAECQNSNVMIEFSCGKITKVKPHFSHNLFVKAYPDQGIIKVCSKTTGQPLAKSYVKVFAKLLNGTIAFYKDGYTDLRGKFDYMQLSTDAVGSIECWSVLVISEAFGTTISEVVNSKREGYMPSKPTKSYNQKAKEKRKKEAYFAKKK
uniref:Uncharacterized protein n=1 Tax=Arcella intermedia TaxID=1963864 RepID=A0A6B2KWL3_9EUKA